MIYVYIFMALAVSYLIGSIPTAYIFTRIIKGVDIREYGSGNVGGTNVIRVVGKVSGITVMVLDALKGFFTVTVLPLYLKYIIPQIDGKYSYVVIFMGAAAIAGHVWTVFLNFKGGKGVATTAGVMVGIAPAIFGMCFCIWGIIFVIWRYVSLASITAALMLPVLAVLLNKKTDIIIFCAIAAFLGVYLHRSNIKRLIQGTENKLR